MLNNFRNMMSGESDRPDYSALQLAIPDSDDIVARYNYLQAFYETNEVYDDVARYAYQIGQTIETLQPLINPVWESVEFFATRMLKNPSIVAPETNVQVALDKLWMWSNLKGNSEDYSRGLANLGDLFLKVKNDKSKIWIEKVEARYVTKVEVDSRNIVRECRIDIPIEDNKTYTEYWYDPQDGNEGYVAIYIHNFGKEIEISQLGTPVESASLSEFGVSFIPIVYIRFVEGAERGTSCFSHAIKKIIDADRKLSRHNEILFGYNVPIWSILSTTTDKQGFVNGRNPEIKLVQSTDGISKFQSIKNGYSLVSNIPQLDYTASLASVEFSKKVLEQALPELRSGSIETSQLSGRSIVSLLGNSITRAESARLNMVQGLQRISEMALTIGQFLGIFSDLGTWDGFNYRHTIKTESIVALSLEDKSLMLQQLTSSNVPLKSALRICEFSEAEIEKIMEDKKEETDSLTNSFLNNPKFSSDTNTNPQ